MIKSFYSLMIFSVLKEKIGEGRPAFTLIVCVMTKQECWMLISVLVSRKEKHCSSIKLHAFLTWSCDTFRSGFRAGLYGTLRPPDDLVQWKYELSRNSIIMRTSYIILFLNMEKKERKLIASRSPANN